MPETGAAARHACALAHTYATRHLATMRDRKQKQANANKTSKCKQNKQKQANGSKCLTDRKQNRHRTHDRNGGGDGSAMSDGSTLGGRGSGAAPDLGRMQGDGLAAIGAVDNPLGRSGEQCRNLDTQRRRDFF